MPRNSTRPYELKAIWEITPEQEVVDFIASIRYHSLYKFCRKAFLYGSRSKKVGVTKESDWDIAVPSSGLFAEELSLDGWTQKPLDDNEYRDNYTTHIFEKTFPKGAKVQIAFKNDYESFRAVWDSIPHFVYASCMDKTSPTYVGRDNVANLINSLQFIYESGRLRGQYPNPQDKYLQEVEEQRVRNIQAEGFAAHPVWDEPVQAVGGGGGGGVAPMAWPEVPQVVRAVEVEF